MHHGVRSPKPFWEHNLSHYPRTVENKGDPMKELAEHREELSVNVQVCLAGHGGEEGRGGGHEK